MILKISAKILLRFFFERMKFVLGKISRVHENSLAEKIGLLAGDEIQSINGEKLRDIIDVSFALADEKINLKILRDGQPMKFSVRKNFDDELGIEFEEAVFDGILPCCNACQFCFVMQMPRGKNLRKSLYVKDDDFRLSFLYGNFITLSNLTDEHVKRIAQFHLSPLYISVHTMNMDLRADLMGTPKAKNFLQRLEQLEDFGIEYHAQIVLCRNINDGDELNFTLNELLKRLPSVLSVAIVPVGLTKFRDENHCPKIEMFDQESAAQVIEQVKQFQEKAKKICQRNLFYLSDEFYILAGKKLPSVEDYDGFPQLDNGIGLARNFYADFQEEAQKRNFGKEKNLLVICGTSIQKILAELLQTLPKNFQDKILLLPVKNDFFGEMVNVSGLLTGQDIYAAIKNLGRKNFDGVILPKSCLRSGEDVFLDDMSLNELRLTLQKEGLAENVCYVQTGKEFFQAVTSFEKFIQKDQPTEKIFTWQSNAGYSQ